jgi:glycosyltransferase involved in cell wall biosynthesis
MSLSNLDSIEKNPAPASGRRILFLNDLGFQYGAGIAQARQIQSFLVGGWEVGALAWEPGDLGLDKLLTRSPQADLWLGLHRLTRPSTERLETDEFIEAGLMMEIATFNPDVVIVGNIHSAKWSLKLLPAIRELGPRVIAYMHDGYLFTGRCPYPGTCELFLTGCDETCPTATEYPPLPPEQIAPQWQLRRQIFGGPDGIEVVANSRWTRDTFRKSIPEYRSCETVYLSADETVFCPGDRASARAGLNLPDDKPIVLCAAVNYREKRKGAHHLRAAIKALGDRVTFAAIGHNTHDFPELIGLGYHTDQFMLARVYQAADIFFGTADEEAFGQTVLEAQLCGLPVVAFDVGGVHEIVNSEQTGLLVPKNDSSGAINALKDLIENEDKRLQFGKAGRQANAERYGIEAQFNRWETYLSKDPKTAE